MFSDQHLRVAPTVDTSAANCCPKNFVPDWQLLPINGTKPFVAWQVIQWKPMVGNSLEWRQAIVTSTCASMWLTLNSLWFQKEDFWVKATRLNLARMRCSWHLHVEVRSHFIDMVHFVYETLGSILWSCWLFMNSSNQRFLNQLQMRIPPKILWHQLLVLSQYTIMLSRHVLIRYHRRQRKNLFRPEATSDRPWAWEDCPTL